jgi:putative transposase
MELATRKVLFAPTKLQPDGKYMRQVVRIQTDSEDGFLYGKPYLIHDRDPLYRTEGFHETLKSSGIEPVKLPACSPDLNCYAERFVKSIKSECLEHLILPSVKHLEYVLGQYCAYYHHERIHQGVGRIIESKHPIDDTADIVCVERLDGLLKSYHRLAA